MILMMTTTKSRPTPRAGRPSGALRASTDPGQEHFSAVQYGSAPRTGLKQQSDNMAVSPRIGHSQALGPRLPPSSEAGPAQHDLPLLVRSLLHLEALAGGQEPVEDEPLDGLEIDLNLYVRGEAVRNETGERVRLHVAVTRGLRRAHSCCGLLHARRKLHHDATQRKRCRHQLVHMFVIKQQ